VTKFLLALILVAVQTAALAHDHAGAAHSGEAASQVCEFCTGFATGAPPLADATVAHHAQPMPAAVPGYEPLPPRSHPACAGLSRAPPAIRC
jgi:hypothetical protein